MLARRVSTADARERHRGVSHHTRAVIELAGSSLTLAEGDGDGWREACTGLPLAHMGRAPADDPAHFAAAFAAGIEARRLLRTPL